MKQKRRTAAGVTGTVLGLVLWSTCAATAGAEPGEALGSYVMGASASGYHLLLGGQIDGTVPDASSTFETGGLGYSRAAIAWPGALAANAGDLIAVVGAGQLPKDLEGPVRMLNDPVRAEARTPSGPAEASYDQVPGVVMHSTAGETGSGADASLRERSRSPGAADVGGAASRTSTRLDAGRALSEATSSVTDIDLAGGLIHIDSIVSKATATSDGLKGGGTAATTVNGVTVSGQPATIDENGLRLGSSDGAPVNAVANQLAESALAQAGIRVVVSKPLITAQGPSATAGAGAVLIAVGESDLGIVFGGAKASASASPPFDEAATGLDDRGATSGGGSVSVGPSPGSASPSVTPPSGGTKQPTPARLFDADLVAEVGQANPLWLALVGGFVGCLLAGAMRRLGTGMLELGPVCDQGEPS